MRLLLLLLALVAAPVLADSRAPEAPLANQQLTDPAREAQARALMEDIRCLVCDGQSVADSNAELAGDMRALIRQRIEAGEEPNAVKDWLVDRYGNSITYDPPLGVDTVMLWAMPVILFGLGLVLARGRIGKRKA
jgi:cytochrome c-type biogenesis protein CcmH